MRSIAGRHALPLQPSIWPQGLFDYRQEFRRRERKALMLVRSVPLLIIHGDQDESVSLQHAENLYNIVPHSILIKVEGGTHTFGAQHPFDPSTDVTPMLEELIENTFEFVTD
jgi:pimeloyl-ACP methyl ester carboxylesterase